MDDIDDVNYFTDKCFSFIMAILSVMVGNSYFLLNIKLRRQMDINP